LEHAENGFWIGEILNYEPNTIDWEIGSIVISDSDAKEPRMLMTVIGKDENWYMCCLLSQLINLPHYHINWRKIEKEGLGVEVYPNRKEFLHHPKRFGIVFDSKRSIFVKKKKGFRAKIWPRRFQ
jgi:hypothetical protein